MSYIPKPSTPAPICSECSNEAIWDTKWGDWYCFECDNGKSLK